MEHELSMSEKTESMEPTMHKPWLPEELFYSV
jgi:hypothetical protein